TEVSFVVVGALLNGFAVRLLGLGETAERDVHGGIIHVRLEVLAVEGTCLGKALHGTVEVVHLDLDQASRVVNRRVAPVFLDRLRGHQSRQLELLLAHLGALRTSDNETTSTTLLTSTRLLLRALHAIDSELVEGRHVTAVDG